MAGRRLPPCDLESTGRDTRAASSHRRTTVEVHASRADPRRPSDVVVTYEELPMTPSTRSSSASPRGTPAPACSREALPLSSGRDGGGPRELCRSGLAESTQSSWVSPPPGRTGDGDSPNRSSHHEQADASYVVAGGPGYAPAWENAARLTSKAAGDGCGSCTPGTGSPGPSDGQTWRRRLPVACAMASVAPVC